MFRQRPAKPWLRQRPWRHHAEAHRPVHSCAPLFKNPYYFYDLQRQQPSASSRAEDPTLGSNHRMFDPLASQSSETMQERVRKVFGDLGSRDESRKEALAQGITVAGIRVPARPEEPTNCCMSGCVNCVWELYKDELEDWKSVRKQAREKLELPQYRHVKWPPQLGAEPAGRSGETSGEASAELAKPIEAESDEDDLGINYGIRVFIETERRIKARRAQRGEAPQNSSQQQQQQQQHQQQQQQ